MCPPDFYGIDYEINPWMDRRQPGRPAAGGASSGRHCGGCWSRRGRQCLVHDAGGRAARPGLHGQCGLDPRPHGDPLPFPPSRAARRRAALARNGCRQHGFEVRRLRSRDCSSKGRATRCSAATRCLPAIGSAATCGAAAGRRVARLPRHSVGTGRPAVLSPRHVLLSPGGRRGDLLSRPRWTTTASGRSRRRLPRADRRERSRGGGGFACNAVVVGRTVITNTGCPRPAPRLRPRGFTARETPLGEFVKAGGSAKCLTLRLDEGSGMRDQG